MTSLEPATPVAARLGVWAGSIGEAGFGAERAGVA